MKSSPLISIIIPAYNSDHFLSSTLDSVLAQSVMNWECIVVDDGSTDGTATIAEKYASSDNRVRLVRQANLGVAGAYNRGLKEASLVSKYVSILDHDDVWMKDVLKTLKDELERYPEAAGAHALAEMIDENGNPLMPGSLADTGRNRIGFNGRAFVDWDISKPTTFESLFMYAKIVPFSLVLTRKKIYEKVGVFDTKLKVYADWDMLIRLSRYGEFRFINKVLMSYRRHGTNTSRNSSLNFREGRYVHHKMFFSSENNEKQKKIVKDGWRAWQIFMIKQKSRFAVEHLKNKKYLQVVVMLFHIFVHSCRYIIGHPTLRGV